jgi:hypothetical protein
MAISCPICGNGEAKELRPSDAFDGSECDCPRCGRYSITGTAVATWGASGASPRQVANASGWIREHQGVRIGSEDIQSLLAVEPPSVAERADRLLVAIAQEFPDLGHIFQIAYRAPVLLGTSWSAGSDEVVYLLNEYLAEAAGFLKNQGIVGAFLGSITPRGYARLQEIQHSRVASNIGFCAMWFDPTVKTVWTDAIEPAIRNAGYDAKRIDSHEHNNRIDDEILAMIRRSKFVVADFTGQRGGVYFEAGFALGLGLPVVWTCSEEALKEVHFDNRQYAFVTWSPGKLDEFRNRLQNRIEATIGRGPV